MDHSAGIGPGAGAMELSSTTAASIPPCHHSSTTQQQQGAVTDASSPSSSSRLSTAFDFSSAPSDDTMLSFNQALAAFPNMSFTRPSAPSLSLRERGSNPPAAPRPPEGFRPATMASSHDSKRVKVDPETPALDSMDSWIRFDDDVDKMGSFEIDYSKRNDRVLNGLGSVSTMPGLGSGLYSTAMAPFREEDFIDDTAFDEQALSDDEDVFDTINYGERPSEAKSQPQQTASSAAPLPPVERPLFNFPPIAWGGRAPSGIRLTPNVDEDPRQMRRDIWGGLPRSTAQVLSPEEKRRLLEIALNSGQMPGSFIPPNGFGIGFGAGLGARPPAEFERKAGSSLTTTLGAAAQNKAPAASPVTDEAEDQSAASKQIPRRPVPSRTGSSRKSADNVTAEKTKPRSADRIAHNDVERKYRTNLKVKIAELRDAVPALQSPTPCTEAESGSGQQGPPKVSKGTVLTKATEYIQQLEQRNKAIVLEHQQLARRLQAFETLFNSAARQPDLMPNPSMTLFDPRGFC
ncbi:hypothetical protein HIM_05999 [Hirsutella minnesotensis 3608]|uniref:BHLH domain-containing protein n=1 Tax=Hirsutella minnesotensis 3608 TaxID=1043627 RepID=A0A0F8A537_9HYPO|nr:hypothetical protein HIM_05999 [Hirsutella minnesotensis 3608]